MLVILHTQRVLARVFSYVYITRNEPERTQQYPNSVAGDSKDCKVVHKPRYASDVERKVAQYLTDNPPSRYKD